MKKVLVTTVILIAVWAISFKAVPSLYPGISTLTDYKSIQIQPIEDSDFKNRIDNLEYVVEEYKANGNPYVIDSVQRLDDAETESQENAEPVVEEPVEEVVETEPTESTEPTQPTESTDPAQTETQPNDVQALTELKLDDVMLIGVEADKIAFIVDGKEYTSAIGMIGQTNVEIVEINLNDKSATLTQDGNTRLLVLGF